MTTRLGLRSPAGSKAFSKSAVGTAAVHLARRFEAVATKLAKQAQKKAGERGVEGGRGKKKTLRKTLPKASQDETKRTRSQAAATVGMSGPTYEKAKAVVLILVDTPAALPDRCYGKSRKHSTGIAPQKNGAMENQKASRNSLLRLALLIGATGFEPATF